MFSAKSDWPDITHTRPFLWLVTISDRGSTEKLNATVLTCQEPKYEAINNHLKPQRHCLLGPWVCGLCFDRLCLATALITYVFFICYLCLLQIIELSWAQACPTTAPAQYQWYWTHVAIFNMYALQSVLPFSTLIQISAVNDRWASFRITSIYATLNFTFTHPPPRC